MKVSLLRHLICSMCSLYFYTTCRRVNNRRTNTPLIFVVSASVLSWRFSQTVSLLFIHSSSCSHQLLFSPLIIQQFLGLSHFLSAPPFTSLHYLLFSCYTSNSQLYILAHMMYSICVSHFWIQISSWLTGTHLFTGRAFPTSLPPSPQSSFCFSCHSCLLPSILSSSIRLPLSSTPSVLLSSVQLHSNPGRQQDLELTGEMRWWNGITSVVRMCVCLVRECVCVCSMNLSSGSH